MSDWESPIPEAAEEIGGTARARVQTQHGDLEAEVDMRVVDVGANPEVSKLWVPWDRLESLHEPGIQGCDRVVRDADHRGETA